MEVHRIMDDLEQHAWYADLVLFTVSGAEAFAARWATFEDAVEALGEAENAEPAEAA